MNVLKCAIVGIGVFGAFHYSESRGEIIHADFENDAVGSVPGDWVAAYNGYSPIEVGVSDLVARTGR